MRNLILGSVLMLFLCSCVFIWTYTRYLPDTSETNLMQKGPFKYEIYGDKSVSVWINTLFQPKDNPYSEMTISVSSAKSDSIQSVSCKIINLDASLTDRNDKALDKATTFTIKTPKNSFDDVSFQAIPDSARYTNNKGGSVSLTNFYQKDLKKFPKKLTMHCHAELEVNGKPVIVDRKVNLKRTTKIEFGRF